MDLATLGIAIRSDGMVVALEKLDELEKRARRAEGATNSMSEAADRAARAQNQLASASRSSADSMGALADAAKLFIAALAVEKVAAFTAEAIKMRAQYDMLGAAMKVVGENVGYTQSQMATYEKGLQNTGIAMLEARQNLTRMAAAHLDLSKAVELGRTAQNAARIANISSSEAFERMIHAIVAGQPLILHNMGIMVSLEQAHKDYAKTLNKSKDDLTQYEKATANMNAVLAEGAARQGVYAEAMKTAGGQLLSFKRYYEDFKTTLGGAFQEDFRSSILKAADAFKDLRAEIERPETQAQLKEISKAVFGIGDTLTSMVVPGFKGVVSVVGELSGAWNKLPQDLRNVLMGAAMGRIAGPMGALAGGVLGAVMGPQDEAKIAYYDKGIAEANEAIKVAQAGGSWSDRMLAKLGYTAPAGTAAPTVENLTAYRDRLVLEQSKLTGPQVLSDAYKVQAQDPLLRNLAANRNVEEALKGKARTELQATVAGADLLIEKGEKEAARDPSGKLAKLLKDKTQYSDDYAKVTGDLYKTLYFPTDDKAFETAKNKLHELETLYGPAMKGFQKEIDATTKSMNAGGKEAAKFGEESRAFLESVQNKMESVKGELDGENYVTMVAKISQEIANLQKRINDAKIDSKGDLGGYLAAQALLPQLQQEMLKRAYFKDYEKGMKEEAAHEKTMAELQGGNKYEAENKALKNQLDLLEMKRANGIDTVKLAREEEEVRARIKKNLQDEAAWRAQQKGDYAQLTGNARAMYQAQAEQLRIQIEATDDLNTKIILTEKLAEVSARAELNIGKLVQAGINKASIKAYDDLIDKIENALPAALDQFSMAVVGNMTDLISGAVTADKAFANMINTLKRGLIQIILELGMAYLKMEALAMLSGAISNTNLAGGTSAGGSTAAGAARGKSSGGGFSMSDIAQYGSKAADLFGGSGAITADTIGSMQAGSSAYSMGTEAFDMSLAAGGSHAEAVNAAVAAANSAPDAASAMGATSTGLGAAAAAGGIGYMAGGLMRPDIPAAGYVGGAAGALTAGALSSSAIGSALGAGGAIMGGLAATGVGAIVGIAAAAVIALTAGETKTTSKTGEKGITINMSMPGQTIVNGWEGMRTVTSGMFGSSSTKHWKNLVQADPEMQRAWEEKMTSASRAMTDSMETLSMATDSLKDFTFPIEFDVNMDNMDKAVYNISNAMAQFVIEQSGMKAEFDSTAKAGEMYIDQIKRLSEAYGKTAIFAEAAGTSLERMSGSLSRVVQSNYASKLIDSLGSAEAVQNALNLNAKYNVPVEDQYRFKMNFMGRTAGESVGRIGDPNVNVTNFWGKYAESLNAPMSADDRSKWMKAATVVDSFYESTVAYLQSANNKRIAVLQKETQVLQQNIQVAQSSVNTWGNLTKVLGNALDSIRFDKNLSALNPQQIYEGQYSKFMQLSALAKGGDQTAMQEVAGFSKDFLEGSQDFWGSTARYYDDFNMVSDTLTTTKSLAQQQYDIAVQQYNAALTQIEQNNREIAELQNANANIVNSANMLAQAIASNSHVANAVAAANVSQAASQAAGGGGGGGGGDGGGGGSGGSGGTASSGVSETVANWGNPDGGWSTASIDDPQAQANAQAYYEMVIAQLGWGGERAIGGPVTPGGSYLVGENGPEIVSFPAAGVVSSSSSSGDLMSGFSASMDANTRVSSAGFQAMQMQLASMTKQMSAMTSQLSRLVAAPRS